jgi:hypothetical protein
VLAAHLYLTALDASSPEELGTRRVTVEGPEAEALHAYLKRVGWHLEDLGAG